MRALRHSACETTGGGATVSAIVSLLQFGDVDFVHLKHGSQDAIGFFPVGIVQHFEKHARSDLPGKAVLVLQPAAGALLATAGREFAGVVIDLLLITAVDHERNGFRELVMWAAVQCSEGAAIEFKQHGHHRTRFAAVSFLTFVAVMRYLRNLRTGKDAAIEFGSFFGLMVEPQEWPQPFEMLHDISPHARCATFLRYASRRSKELFQP